MPRPPRTFVVSITTASLILLSTGGASASPFFYSTFNYSFSVIKSDGLSGIKEPFEIAEQRTLTTVGGSHPVTAGIDLEFSIPPRPGVQANIKHLRVFASPNGTKFFSKSQSPATSVNPQEDENIGGVARMKIAQAFEKVEENAELTFTIDAMHLAAFGIRNGPPGSLLASIEYVANVFTSLGPVDSFATQVTLSGRPEMWELDNPGPLATKVTFGGSDQQGMQVDLDSLYMEAFDLSGVDVGTTVFLTYEITTSAYDTYQFDSFARAFGRDPLNLDSGLSLASSGLIPLNTVPEPGGFPLFLGGIGLLLIATLVRRARPVAGPSQ